MRKHTVFSQLAKAQILLAASYTAGLSDMLHQQDTGNSPGAAEKPSRTLVCATARCLWALTLMLHTIEECVVDHVIVQQSAEVDVLVKACVEMRCHFARAKGNIDIKAPVGREVFGCGFVRGCQAFARLDLHQEEPGDAPDGAAQSPTNPEQRNINVLHSPALSYSHVLHKFAQRLSAVDWHSGTASAGGCLKGVSEAIRQWTVQPGSETQKQVTAEYRVQSSTSGGSGGDTDEDLDDIVLAPQAPLP